MTYFFALTRAIHFASLMILFGACAFAWLARKQLRVDIGVSSKALAVCGGIAVLTVILSVGFVAAQMTGSSSVMFDPATEWVVYSRTLFGRLALVRVWLLCAFPLVVLFYPRAMLIAGMICGGGALALLGPTSHASRAVADQYVYLLAANDSVHLLAGGFWLGGLVALVPATLAKPRDSQRLLALLRLFSRWATAAVGVLILAGTANGFAILDMRGMAWSETYIDWLAIKLVLAGVMMALALTNRFGLLPALVRGEKEAEETLPLTLFAELGCAALILLAVGILGLTAPMQM
jgi:putative copper resistance protein D